MSTNDGKGNAGRDRPRDPAGTEPGYTGAKPGTLGAGGFGYFGYYAADGFAESGPMSARLAQNWWAIALRGVVAIIFGLIALLMPGITLGALVLLFAAYMLVDGIFAIVAGVRAAAHHERWGAFILEGIVDLIAAAIAILAPIATILAFVWLSAAWAIVTGSLMLAATFRLRPTHGKWWLGLGGALSVVWGVLLIVAPLVGAVVMTLWLGAYALVFGIALLVLAFRLKRRRDEPTGATTQPA
jgi:uncharacterized membrane protein HdeD (DUF308 family)